MDVCGLFIGDTTMSYGSIRSTLYRDYEKFPYGTFETNKNPTIKDYYSKVQEKCQQIKEQKLAKQSCPFCRDHKKRPLNNYMRKRENKKLNEKICEEEEEEEEEQYEHDHNQHEHKHNHHNHQHATADTIKNCEIKNN